MAYRAGATLSDMEFFQFHPTALSVAGAPRFLLSEALRGEGALLLNPARVRFMPQHHPMAELAPRDVVARAIVQEIAASKNAQATAYLDMRHLDAAILRARFPRIYSTCQQYGIDITRDLIPVRPAAHYLMGGIKTDLHGLSSIEGLYAAGETACTGVHGANRLASNSLLEGLVFGARVVDAMREEHGTTAATPCGGSEARAAADAVEIAGQLRQAMWQHAGVVRTKKGLEQLQQLIPNWEDALGEASTRQPIETRNLLTIGGLIVRSALAREESRGAHYRNDFPKHNDKEFLKHTVLRKRQITFE
jgi:L-aspartate oxidase